MNSSAEENYLKALLALSHPTGEVNVKELSEHLGIKMPTVTSMMKKLSDKKLVHYESYKPLRLSDSGRQTAGLIVRKHRLTEMFLVQKMGFGWEEVHDIAEQIEHLKSPLFFEKMDELLGFPTVDPHGSPIPDRQGRMEWPGYVKLSECALGDRVRLQAVMNTSADFLKFLNSRELHLGVEITVKSIEPFDGTMVLQYEQRSAETLSQVVCARLLVLKS